MLKKTFTLVALVIVTFSISGCGGHSDKVNSDLTGDVTLDVSTAYPSQSVALKVDATNICSGELSAKIGSGVFAGIWKDEAGTLKFTTPLFYDESIQWSNPPANKVDVTIYCDDQELAYLPNALQFYMLEKSPGTTGNIIQDYLNLISEFGAAVTADYQPATPEQQLLSAAMTAFEALLSNPELSVFQDTSSDIDVELLDAILHAHGYDEKITQLKSLFEMFRNVTDDNQSEFSVSGKIANKNSDITLHNYGRRPITTTVTDTALALKMQKYVVLKEFIETFLHNTITQYQVFASILVLIPGGQAHAAAVGELANTLTVFEFMLSKLVLSSMPAELVSLELTVDDTDLDNNVITDSQLIVTAKNKPVGMSINDLVGLVTARISSMAGSNSTIDQQKLETVFNAFLAVFNDAMNAFLNAHPNTGLVYDMDVFNLVPDLVWKANATTRKFYVLGPLAARSLVEPLTNEIEWKTDDHNSGSVGLYVLPSMDANARLISSFLGGTYNGGAFGLNSLQSNVVQLNVNFNLTMNATVTSCVETGQSGHINVLVGNTPTNGSFVPLSGMQVEVHSFDISANAYNGLSDASGSFSTDFTVDQGVQNLTIVIKAYDPSDSSRVMETPFVVKARDNCDASFVSKERRRDYFVDGQLYATHFYTYDADGNVSSFEDSAPDAGTLSTTTYSYDVNGHIAGGVKLLWSGASYVWSFITNDHGDITSQSTTGYTSNGEIASGPSTVSNSYIYDSSDKVIRATYSGNSCEFQYDGDSLLTDEVCNDGTHIEYVRNAQGNIEQYIDGQFNKLYEIEPIEGVDYYLYGYHFRTPKKLVSGGRIKNTYGTLSMSTSGDGSYYQHYSY
jgi:hypothetical protein